MTARRSRVIAVRTLLVVAGVALWQCLSWAGSLDPDLVASPATIVAGAATIVSEGAAMHAFGVSVLSFFLAFVIGAAAGVISGFGLGVSKVLRAAFMPWFLFWLSAPKSAFLPIFLLMFGIGPDMAVAFGAFSAIPYVAVNVVSGVDLVRTRDARTARAFGAKRWDYFSGVLLPSALPGVVIGLWHAANRAVGGVLIAELFVSTIGVGSLLRRYTAIGDTGLLMGAMVLVTIVAVLFAQVWSMLESKASVWKQREVSAIAP